MQNLLGKDKIIFEAKALSWDVFLLHVAVQVGKRIRKSDRAGNKGE